MSDKSVIIGLSVTFSIIAAGLIIALGIIFGTKVHKVNGHKQWTGKNNSTNSTNTMNPINNTNGTNGTNGGNTNGNGNKSCSTCNSPPPSPRAGSGNGNGYDAIPLPDSVTNSNDAAMIAAASSFTAAPAAVAAASQGSMVTFADTPQVINVPNDSSPALAAIQASQASQAFAGEVPASILKRQAADTFTLASILPPNSAAAAAVAGSTDAAGALMSSFAPNRDKLFAATTQVGACRVPVLNGRSPKSRLVGSSGLLRPPAPIPCKSGGGEISWLDSDLRHYALESNMPPIA